MDKDIKIALILTAVDKMSAVAAAAAAKVEKRLGGLHKVSSALNSIGNRSLLAGGAITGYLATTVNDAQQSAIAAASLQQVFKTMGETTNDAANASSEYANKLQYQIGIEDEVIEGVQTKLATFKKASNEAARSSGLFNRITASAFDLAAIGYGDAASNIVQLGKAFQDPIKGAAALKKAGTLTNDDLSVLKIISKTRGLPAAQDYIIKALEKQAKGQAALKASPVDKVKIAYSELSETIGRHVLPYAQQFAEYLSKVIPKVDAFIQHNGNLIKTIAKIGLGLLGFGLATKLLSGAIGTVTTVYKGYTVASELFGKLNKAQGLGISNLRYKFEYLKLAITDGTKAVGGMASAGWDKLKAGLNVTKTAVISATQAFARFAIALLTNPITWIILGVVALAAAVYLIYKNWDKVGPWLKDQWETIKKQLHAAWEFIKNLFFKFSPLGIIIANWKPITKWLSDMWEKIKSTFWAAVDWVMSLGSKFFDAGANLISSIINGIKSKIEAVVNVVKNIAQRIRNHFTFSPAKEGPLRDIHKIKLIETIAQTIRPQPAIDAMRRATGAIAAYNPGNSMAMAPAYNGGGYHININLSGGATQADANTVSRELRKTVLAIQREEENRLRRVSLNR